MGNSLETGKISIINFAFFVEGKEGGVSAVFCFSRVYLIWAADDKRLSFAKNNRADGYTPNGANTLVSI
jgi:hypothetical protein